jgi:hypothetical protein
VTPAGKIGNCTCGMPKLLPHSGKKSTLLSPSAHSKTVSSHFPTSLGSKRGDLEL